METRLGPVSIPDPRFPSGWRFGRTRVAAATRNGWSLSGIHWL